MLHPCTTWVCCTPVPPGLYTACTPPGLYTACTPPGLYPGIHHLGYTRVFTTWAITGHIHHLGHNWAYTPPGYIHPGYTTLYTLLLSYTPLGTPCSHLRSSVRTRRQCGTGRTVTSLWAQSGRKAWVRASVLLLSPKGVREGVSLRAGCFRFSGNKERKDRIA